jgi:hypothetical protein
LKAKPVDDPWGEHGRALTGFAFNYPTPNRNTPRGTQLSGGLSQMSLDIPAWWPLAVVLVIWTLIVLVYGPRVKECARLELWA